MLAHRESADLMSRWRTTAQRRRRSTGYDFEFGSYSLSYLSNDNWDSRTEGSVHVPFPSAFVQPFEKLKFDCLGRTQ